MRRGYTYIIVAIVFAALLVAGGIRLLADSESAPTPEPPPTEAGTELTPEPPPAEPENDLGCCQCTALGRDQHYPFPQEPGYTCEEYCFKGCLERGYAELVCKLGGVGGYALECPDVIPPTVTPFGE